MYPVILALGRLLPSLLWICLVSRLVYPILILNSILTSIFFPLGKMTFHLCSRKQASFCQAGPGRLAVLLQAVQEGLSCLVSCPHLSYTSDPLIYLEERSSTFCEHFYYILIVSHILVECNDFAGKRKYIFGKRNVVESHTFYCQFYSKF